MRHHPIGLWLTLTLTLTLAGCALPGSGDGFGGGDDSEASDAGGSQVFVRQPAPTSSGSFGSPGSSGSPGGLGSPGTAGSGSFGMPPGGAGSGAAPAPRMSAWPGFTLVPGLSATCPIATADDPATEYGSLQTKPCTNGTTGCAELVWTGLTPTASEIGVDPFWDVDLITDDEGVATHMIVTRRYGRGNAGAEVVVFELADGSAVAGFRNGEPSPFGTVLPALDSRCSIAIAGGRGRMWMVVSEAGVTRVGSAAVDDLGEQLALGAIDVDASVIDGTMIGGAGRLALEAEDGQLYLVTTALEVTATYGPDVRVWLSAPVRDGVLVRAQAADGISSNYFLMDAAGAFTPLLTNVQVAGSDAASLAWLERDADQSSLHVASASGDSSFDVSGAQAIPIVKTYVDGDTEAPVVFSSAHDLQLIDGRFVLRGTTGTSFSDSAFIVDMDGQVLGEVPIGDTLGGKNPVFALLGPHLWIGTGYEDKGTFPTLQRIEY